MRFFILFFTLLLTVSVAWGEAATPVVPHAPPPDPQLTPKVLQLYLGHPLKLIERDMQGYDWQTMIEAIQSGALQKRMTLDEESIREKLYLQRIEMMPRCMRLDMLLVNCSEHYQRKAGTAVRCTIKATVCLHPLSGGSHGTNHQND